MAVVKNVHRPSQPGKGVRWEWDGGMADAVAAGGEGMGGVGCVLFWCGVGMMGGGDDGVVVGAGAVVDVGQETALFVNRMGGGEGKGRGGDGEGYEGVEAVMLFVETVP